jgi:adenylate cyclase
MLGAVAEGRAANDLRLDVRIVLASGRVGGVIGERRILFDLWCDTGNTAWRMESSGIRGRPPLFRRAGARRQGRPESAR